MRMRDIEAGKLYKIKGRTMPGLVVEKGFRPGMTGKAGVKVQWPHKGHSGNAGWYMPTNQVEELWEEYEAKKRVADQRWEESRAREAEMSLLAPCLKKAMADLFPDGGYLVYRRGDGIVFTDPEVMRRMVFIVRGAAS